MRINLDYIMWPCLGLVFFALCPTSISSAKQVSLGPYTSIVAKDPFDPDRGRKAGEGGHFDVTPENDIEGRYQVYGTIIMGGQSKAFIKESTKGGPQARSRRTKGASDVRSVVVGDIIDGWEVKEITEKGVVLEAEGKKAVLGLFDSEKKERQAKAPVALQTPQLKQQPIPSLVPVQATRAPSKGKNKAVQPKPKGSQHRPPGISVPPVGKKQPAPSAKQEEKAPPPPLPPNIGGPKIKKPANSKGNAVPAAPSEPATNPFLEMIRQYQGGG